MPTAKKPSLHLKPVPKLRMRLARVYGSSFSEIANDARVSQNTAHYICRDYPRGPEGQEREKAMATLRTQTLAELGADPAATSLWLAMQAATLADDLAPVDQVDLSSLMPDSDAVSSALTRMIDELAIDPAELQRMINDLVADLAAPAPKKRAPRSKPAAVKPASKAKRTTRKEARP